MTDQQPSQTVTVDIAAEVEKRLEKIWNSPDGPSKNEQICQMFYDFVKKYDLSAHKGQRVHFLCRCLEVVIIELTCLKLTDLKILKMNYRKGMNMDEAWKQVRSVTASKPYRMFVEDVYNYEFKNVMWFYDAVNRWRHAARRALYKLEDSLREENIENIGCVCSSRAATNPDTRSIVIKARQVYKCWERVKLVAPLFKDDPVRSAYIRKFEQVRNRGVELDQKGGEEDSTFIYPFTYIGAPSGSGKTTFAQSMYIVLVIPLSQTGL